MTIVKSLATQGLTVCSTIHAPSPSVHALFDNLVVLLGGSVVYAGPNSDAVAYFSSFALQAYTSTLSDAEWLTKVVVEAGRSGQANKLAESYLTSQAAATTAVRIAELSDESFPLAPEEVKALKTRNPTANPSWWSIRTLLKYRMAADYKSFLFWSARIIDKFVFAFIIATLYWNVGENMDQAKTLNTSAALFMWALLPGFASISFLPALILERVLYLRERNDGMYSAGAYLAHKFIEELVIIVVVSLIFAVAVWFCLSLSGSYVLFTLVYFVTTCVGVALGYFVSAVAPNMEVAQVATAGYVVVLLFFAGLLMRLEDIPGYWYWFSVIDFIRYAWGSLMVNQFQNLPDAEWPLVLYHPLYYLGLENVDKWAYLGYESIFAVVFAAGAWAALAYMPYGRR